MNKWNGLKKAVTFSFDDGVCQDVRLVKILNEYGLKCTFNINTGIQTYANAWENKGVEIHRMNVKGLKELYQCHEVAVHSLTHPRLELLDKETVFNELSLDIQNIERIFGYTPVGLAYPYGTYNQEVIDVAKSLGLKYARTAGTSMKFSIPDDLMRYSGTCHFLNADMDKLFDEFFKDGNEEKLFYIWGHSYEFDTESCWHIIENIAKRLYERKDEIFFGTNKEVFGF